MVATSQILLVLGFCLVMIFSMMESTDAAPFGGFGGGHHGHGDLGTILAAGLVLSLLQNN